MTASDLKAATAPKEPSILAACQGGRWLACVILVIFASSTGLPAQSSDSPGDRIVTVAMTNSLPHPGGRAMVIRRQMKIPSVLVLLDESATVADLASALGATARSFSTHPQSWGTAELRIAITRAALGGEDTTVPMRHLGTMLERLRTSPRRSILGYGELRSITLPVPLMRTP